MQLVTQPVKKINSEVELQITPMYLTPQDDYVPPLPPKTVSQFVIPAKSRKAGREPGSRQRPREGGEPDIK